jgi:hypothetical protein
MSTWADLSGENTWVLHLDGIFYLIVYLVGEIKLTYRRNLKLNLHTRTGGDNMIVIDHGFDFEMCNITLKGAVQALRLCISCS